MKKSASSSAALAEALLIRRNEMRATLRERYADVISPFTISIRAVCARDALDPLAAALKLIEESPDTSDHFAACAVVAALDLLALAGGIDGAQPITLISAH